MSENKSLNDVKEMADKITDGHFTIFSFTTGYKGFFGTPYDDYELRCLLSFLKPYKNVEDLYTDMIEYSDIYMWDDDLIKYAIEMFESKSQ